MKKIIYVSPYRRSQISGGIKVMYRHVEMLNEHGFSAKIFSPAGHPNWFASTAPLIQGNAIPNNGDHVLVFTEDLNGQVAEIIQRKFHASKVLLCQNQYRSFSEALSGSSYSELGFEHFITVGQIARGFLERVHSPARFDVVPVWVDDALFTPRAKELRISVIPRKLRTEFRVIREIFSRKYADLARLVSWDVIDKVSEEATAEIMGKSAVFLSLSDMECCPLTPLEAMSSGCLVVGFHGYGGMEYASKDNGIWISPDALEETADALAGAMTGFQSQDPEFVRMRDNGMATAKSFNERRTIDELTRVFTAIAA